MMTADSTRAARSLQALDIIIVNYNTRQDLAACLRSLQVAPPTRPHTIVVVDNGSSDDSVGATRRDFPAARIIEMGRNAGFAAANNAGIRATASPLIVLLNSDTIVPAGALDRLAERLEATGAVAAGPRLRDGRGWPEMSWGAMLTPLSEWRQATLVRANAHGERRATSRVKALTAAEREVDWVSGACLLVTREAAVAAGLLDERYFMYEEDVDFCAALRAGGGRILFTPAAEITHLRGRSMTNAPARRPSHYDESHLKFYEKHAPQWVPWLRRWKRVRGRI